jgi:hypothetical protein
MRYSVLGSPCWRPLTTVDVVAGVGMAVVAVVDVPAAAADADEFVSFVFIK